MYGVPTYLVPGCITATAAAAAARARGCQWHLAVATHHHCACATLFSFLQVWDKFRRAQETDRQQLASITAPVASRLQTYKSSCTQPTTSSRQRLAGALETGNADRHVVILHIRVFPHTKNKASKSSAVSVRNRPSSICQTQISVIPYF